MRAQRKSYEDDYFQIFYLSSLTVFLHVFTRFLKLSCTIQAL